MTSRHFALRILRQGEWEDFTLEAPEDASIAALLFALQLRPIRADGKRVEPIAFESACGGDGCGACTLLVNGRVRPACRSRAASYAIKNRPISLAPLSKFPLIRDLIVDREALYDARSTMRASAGTSNRRGPREIARLDRCIGCGACVEACPEARPGARFVGAAALNDARIANLLAPSDEKLDAVMGPGGIADCGKAQNCVEVCPESIPLFDSILALERETTRRWLRTLLRR